MDTERFRFYVIICIIKQTGRHLPVYISQVLILWECKMKKEKAKASAASQSFIASMENRKETFEFEDVNRKNLETFIKFLSNKEFFNDSLKYNKSLSVEQNLLNLLMLNCEKAVELNLAIRWNYKVLRLWENFIDGDFTINNKLELYELCYTMIHTDTEIESFIYKGLPYYIRKDSSFTIYSMSNDSGGHADSDVENFEFTGKLEGLDND